MSELLSPGRGSTLSPHAALPLRAGTEGSWNLKESVMDGLQELGGIVRLDGKDGPGVAGRPTGRQPAEGSHKYCMPPPHPLSLP